jgi:hypothetical protein
MPSASYCVRSNVTPSVDHNTVTRQADQNQRTDSSPISRLSVVKSHDNIARQWFPVIDQRSSTGVRWLTADENSPPTRLSGQADIGQTISTIVASALFRRSDLRRSGNNATQNSWNFDVRCLASLQAAKISRKAGAKTNERRPQNGRPNQDRQYS